MRQISETGKFMDHPGKGRRKSTIIREIGQPKWCFGAGAREVIRLEEGWVSY